MSPSISTPYVFSIIGLCGVFHIFLSGVEEKYRVIVNEWAVIPVFFLLIGQYVRLPADAMVHTRVVHFLFFVSKVSLPAFFLIQFDTLI